MKQNIIYNRTSTGEQNPENQLADCKTIMERLEIKDYEVLQEQQSAFKQKERPIFQSIINAIRKREIKVLVVWDFDRLYRNRKKTLEFMRTYSKFGLKVYSFRQQFMENINEMPEPWNEIIYDLMLQIVAWMAEDESKKKSARIKAAVRINKKGKTISYKGNIWGRKAVPEKVKMEIIKLREQGKSLREIASEVYYWDASKHKKLVSIGFVHKTLNEFLAKKPRKSELNKSTDL